MAYEVSSLDVYFFKDLTDGTGESGKDSHTCSPAIDGVTRGVFSTVTG